MSTIKHGNQNAVKPLLSGPLLNGQLLFGSQQPKSRKNCQLYNVINSTATSIERLQSASCCPKGDFVLFYTSCLVQSGCF